MKLIKWVLRVVLVLVLLFLAGAYILPREVEVDRQVTINAEPESVFPFVNSLKETEKWSPWLEKDPNVTLTYSGPDSGVGSKMAWSSDVPEVGSGTQEITDSVENSRVETALDFGDMGTAQAYFALNPDGSATAVVWGFRTDTGMNPVTRWMGLFFDKWVGADYEAGLANLKKAVEGQ